MTGETNTSFLWDIDKGSIKPSLARITAFHTCSVIREDQAEQVPQQHPQHGQHQQQQEQQQPGQESDAACKANFIERQSWA